MSGGLLCGIIPISMFYLGPYFNLLPVIAVTLMLLQQKMLTPPPADENQAFQQKMMKWMMVFFGLFFYKVAAGLCIYFIASSLWGLAERKLLPKRPTAAAAAASPPTGSRGGPEKPARNKPRPPKGEDGALQKVRDHRLGYGSAPPAAGSPARAGSGRLACSLASMMSSRSGSRTRVSGSFRTSAWS